VSRNGAEYRTAKIDWTEPYFHMLEMECGSEYWVRVYVFDRAWNMFGHPDNGAQVGPFHMAKDECTRLPAAPGAKVSGSNSESISNSGSKTIR
jgi:hypothetical protein